jgi:signal transduction histidine kinase
MAEIKTADLKGIIAMEGLPDGHLQWIIDHSEFHEYADGDIIAKYGEEAEVMWIALSGKVNFYMYLNGRQVYYFTFDNDQITGGVGGLMPYSRMKTYPGYSYAHGTVRMLRMHKRYFQELELLNPDFIQKLIGYMTQRAKAFATTQLQHEKVNALGNLAAGIAHELNNPSSAIQGVSDELTRRLGNNYDLTKQLLDGQLAADSIELIHKMVQEKELHLAHGVRRTTLQKMQDEDDIFDWLQDNGIAQREVAETFSEYGLAVRDLEGLKKILGPSSFIRVIPWLENLVASQKIIRDMADAAQRISSLVASIKSHVHMDRTRDLQPTNLHQDIENTITLLGFKLREKGITVTRHFWPDLPPVPAFAGELNQVWTNLIDNAIFALSRNGHISIETLLEGKEVIVKVRDDGQGIPADIQSRIFDPFFTTKKVGEGTGIGLDIVNRIVKGHGGTIRVSSIPGKTEFTVTLPLEEKLPDH